MRKGLTLIELIIILAVITILVTYAIPLYLRSQENIKESLNELNNKVVITNYDVLPEGITLSITPGNLYQEPEEEEAEPEDTNPPSSQ